MKFLIPPTLVLALMFFATDILADPPKEIRLWEGPAPGAKGDGPKHTPSMYVYPAKAPLANGAAVIVMPGGGYYVHAIDHEGVQVAKRLNKEGVTAFVLKYRLKPDGYNELDAFVDAKRAVRLVRAKAKEFGIDPNRIGVLGFSAGGHLATALGVNYDSGDKGSADSIEKASCRPDFMIVAYTTPAPLDKRKGREHGWKPVTKDTPPAFLWVTHQDSTRPVETGKFYQSLHEAGVDAELHIYGGWGPHGLGLAPGEPGVSTWPDLMATWMKRKGFLTNKKRVAVSGTATIQGKPVHRGWVKLIPIDAPGSPSVGTFVTEKTEGKFQFEAANGPVPGRYQVEVYLVAKEFLSVPSLEEAQRFSKTAKGEPLIVEIGPDGGELTIDAGS